MSFRDAKAALRRWLWLRNRRRLASRELARAPDYAAWCARHDRLDEEVRAALTQRHRLVHKAEAIEVHLLLSLRDAEAAALQLTLDSLNAQWHPGWRLLLLQRERASPVVQAWADAAVAADPRVQIAAEADLPQQARWLLFANPGEVWREHALLLLVEAAVRAPRLQLVYADHDSLDAAGQRTNPHFKCDWNPELLLSHDYLGPPTMWSAQVLQRAGVRAADGAHRRALSVSLQLSADQVAHIPHVLMHRPPGAPAPDVDLAAVAERLQASDPGARVSPGRYGARVRFALPQPLPTVSIVVPTRNGLGLLRQCVGSLLQLTDYPALDLLIVDNGSDDAACLRYLQQLAGDPRVRVRRDDGPFNYAALNNAAVAQCAGQFVLLLNNDIEVIEAGWLREMVSLAVRPGVGAVGARLLFGDRSLQHAGVVLGLGGEAGHAFRHQPHDSGGYLGRAQRLMALSAVTAACMLVRRQTYLDFGGLDAEHFAVAYNDIDFCLRLQAAGLRNLYTPHAVLLHHESASRGSDSAPGKQRRLAAEQQALHSRWGRQLLRDPAYNPNLSLQSMHFALAEPPRVPLPQLWHEEYAPG